MSASAHYSVEALGALTTAFFIGAGVFQVPAGIFSAHRGAVKSMLLGLAVIVIGSSVSSTTPDLYVQSGARLLTGVGAAFYFAPGMVVVSNLFGESRSGLVVGVYNAAFDLGGTVALAAFTPMSATFGWRSPYEVTALLTAAALAENAWVLRQTEAKMKAEPGAIMRTVGSRQIWRIAIGILGMAAAYYVADQFIVEYSESKLMFGAQSAGLLGSLILAGGIFGGPVGGWVMDRLKHSRMPIVGSVAFTGLTVALYSYRGSEAIWVNSFLLGFFVSVAYTCAYVVPARTKSIGPRYAPIAIGMMNSIGILGGAVAAALFSASVARVGYSESWIAMGVAVVLFIPLLLRINLGQFRQPATHAQEK
ncbi:MAG: MFS transporter [Thermoprotei archaeon]